MSQKASHFGTDVSSRPTEGHDVGAFRDDRDLPVAAPCQHFAERHVEIVAADHTRDAPVRLRETWCHEDDLSHPQGFQQHFGLPFVHIGEGFGQERLESDPLPEAQRWARSKQTVRFLSRILLISLVKNMARIREHHTMDPIPSLAHPTGGHAAVEGGDR